MRLRSFLLTLDVKLERVLDLTVPATRRQRGLTLDALRSPDLLSCQKLARAAREEGYEAIRSPSATATGENLTIFLDRLQPGSLVEVERREPLPLE